MEINYYRDIFPQGYEESWQACQFNASTSSPTSLPPVLNH